jgi:EmrB/QacA subfamily drug resistance transporter
MPRKIPSTANTKQQNIVMTMLLLNAFATPLMLSAVNVALPSIAEDLQLSAIVLSWIPMGYLMTSAMFVLIFGRLADIHGRKKVFLIGTACVIASSILAAISPNGTVLIIARCLQGVSAAMLYATQVAIVSSVFPADKRGQNIGFLVAVIYVGLASGPLLGGLLIDALGWRAGFLLQLPLAVTVLYLGIVKVDAEWISEQESANRSSFDVSGAANYAVAILLICYGVTLLPEVAGYGIVISGVAAMVLFVSQAKKKEHPIWDVNLFFVNRFFTFSCLASLIMYSATYANVVLVSLYLQYLKDFTATEAGLIMMIQPTVMAILSPLAGRLSDHIEPGILASAGMAITASGLILLALLDSTSPVYAIIAPLMVTGIGFSLFSTPNINAIMSSVTSRSFGSASAAIATMRILGQLTSMVLVTLSLAIILGSVQISPGYYAVLEKSIKFSFTLAALLCLPGLFFSLVRGRIHQEKQ